jgi:hypothetical protein
VLSWFSFVHAFGREGVLKYCIKVLLFLLIAAVNNIHDTKCRANLLLARVFGSQNPRFSEVTGHRNHVLAQGGTFMTVHFQNVKLHVVDEE